MDRHRSSRGGATPERVGAPRSNRTAATPQWSAPLPRPSGPRGARPQAPGRQARRSRARPWSGGETLRASGPGEPARRTRRSLGASTQRVYRSGAPSTSIGHRRTEEHGARRDEVDPALVLGHEDEPARWNVPALGERVWGDAVAVIGTPAGQVGGGLRPDNRRQDGVGERAGQAGREILDRPPGAQAHLARADPDVVALDEDQSMPALVNGSGSGGRETSRASAAVCSRAAASARACRPSSRPRGRTPTSASERARGTPRAARATRRGRVRGARARPFTAVEEGRARSRRAPYAPAAGP